MESMKTTRIVALAALLVVAVALATLLFGDQPIRVLLPTEPEAPSRPNIRREIERLLEAGNDPVLVESRVAAGLPPDRAPSADSLLHGTRDPAGLRGADSAAAWSDSARAQRADSSAARVAWDRTAHYYHRHHHHPAWSRDGELRPEAQRLVLALVRVPELGLDPGDYEADALVRLAALAARSDSASEWLRPRTLARFDVTATWAWLRLVADLRHGRILADTLDRDWRRRGEEAFWEEVLDGIGKEDALARVDSLEPRHEEYRRLKTALARYRVIAATGGWGRMPPGSGLERGARGARVAWLVRRLAATGELPAPVKDTVMGPPLEQAVGEFQTRNGIPRSGRVGEATRAALEVPVAERIRQIELNMERWRWLPADLGARHVEVNLPAFRLDLVRAGRSERTMRVVVGKRASPTPVFTDTLRYVELNPTWTLPPSVIAKEILPALRSHPDVLERNHMFVVPLSSGGRRDTLDPRLIPWRHVKADSFPYLIVQGAGPTNPLGSLKLMCPNEYDVYLHDTPQREKFSEAVRDYSHGCVRVAGAVELADSLLDLAPADSARVDTLLTRGEWRRLRLPRPVPVHFLYWTAWSDSTGAVGFRPDLYGLDARLDRALRDRTAPFELNPGVARSPFWVAAHAPRPRPAPAAAASSGAAAR